MSAAQIIKETLSMQQVIEHYGFKANKAGFIPCFIHKEKTASLKIYKEPDRGWHCFGCGAGNNSIDFVMKLFNISFNEAIVRIDNDFNLNIL